MNNLTPAQNARLDQLATRWFRASLWIAAAAWALFAAAVWVGSWRIAGLGALTAVLSAACLLIAAIFHSPSGRRRAAQKLDASTTEETNPHA